MSGTAERPTGSARVAGATSGDAMDGIVEGRGLLSDQIRNALTDEIAAGTLAAGIALDEQELADRFGASRTPVREALRQLAFSGLVEVRPPPRRRRHPDDARAHHGHVRDHRRGRGHVRAPRHLPDDAAGAQRN